MPDTDIIISELSNAPQIDDNAVFVLTQDNAGTPTTFKTTLSALAGKIAESVTFVNLLTTAKNIISAINEVRGVWLTDTLSAGSTSITISDNSITSNSIIDVYTDGDVDYTSITVTTGSVTIQFDAQQSNLGVKVRVL